MAFKIAGRTVIRMRTHLDPMIGPIPKQAFDLRDAKHFSGWYMELTPIGVYVKGRVVMPGQKPRYEEHIVPYSNVQSILLADEVTPEVTPEKPKE